MKKILSLLLVLLCMTGCGKEKTIDLNKVYDEVNKLTYESEIIYNDHKKLTDEELKDYEVDLTNIEEYLIVMPRAIKNPYMYIIVRPKSGKTNIVKDELSELLKKYDNSWGVGEGAIPYFPEAVTLIENRISRTYGNYLIYIVSPDNELVYKAITK